MSNYRYCSSRQPARQAESVRQSFTCQQESCQNDCVRQPSLNTRKGSFSGTSETMICCDDNSKYDELSKMPLAMAYVPWQKWCSLYEADKGFIRGTIFEQLDKPFCGAGGYGR